MKKTIKGFDYYEVLSALHKTIRRGRESHAMHWALELAETDVEALWNKLEVIVNEDVGPANFPLIQLIACLRDQGERARARKSKDWRLMVCNAVMALCRSPKSREADNLTMYTTYERSRNELPSIPDEALDKHTARGKQMGRGMEHFLKEGAKLCNEVKTSSNRFHKNTVKVMIKEQEKENS